MGYRENIPEGKYLSGLDTATEKLQGLVEGMREAGGQGLADAALYILGEAVERAPVDTGNLRGSGYVELDGQRIARGTKGGDCVVTGSVPGEATHAKIGFDAPYAADQHEQVHLNHPRGGRAKYLESVLVEEQGRILNTVAGKMREVMDDA